MRIEAAPAVIDTDSLGSNLITPIGSSPDPHGQCQRAEPADAGGSVDVLAGQPASVLALETTLLVHRDCFKEWEFHAAQRALARLRQAGQPADAVLDRQLILDRHAAIVQDLDPRPDGEAGALRELLSFPVPAPDVAQRIHARSANLADAVAALALRDDLAAERGRLRGAVQAVARIINRRTGATLDAIPARLKDMEDCFERLTHADFGIVASSYDSLKSHVRRVVGLVDNSGKRRLATTLLSPAWRDLAERVKTAAKRARNTSARGGIKGDYAKLYPLIGFCHDHGIAPSAVADATLGDLQAALTLDGCADPFDKARSVVYGWERLQETVPGFPTQTLARLYRAQDGRQSHVKLESMPPEFQADWRAFTARFGEAPDDAASTLSDCVVEDETPPDVDGLDEDLLGDTWGEDPADLPALDEAPDLDAHLSPAYLTCIKSHVVNAAAIALASGRQVSGLGDIVKAPVVERLVRAKLKRQLDKDRDHPRKNATLKNTVTGLLTVARLIGAPKATLDQLEALRDKVDPHLKKRIKGEDGKITRKYSNHRMGPRHKERIEAMANDVALFNWFRMIPVLRDRLLQIVEKGRTPTPVEANDAVALVLHALTRRCPLRRANLAKIPVYGPKPWLRMPLIDGGRARLIVPGEFVKNGMQITVDLDPATVDILRLYLDHVRPVIVARTGADPDNPFLFPAKGRRHRAFESLNATFTDRNWRIGGFLLNLHCQRHLAAKIILDRDTRQMELVRRLLGHKRVSTTELYYAEVNQIFVQREYQALLDERYEELLLARSQHKGRRP